MVGPGETGCGIEMPLEAMTRFLVDPAPYETLVDENNRLVETGVDEVILEQRAAFLRPTSNVAIVLLTDENDCSLSVFNQSHLMLRSIERRAPARSTRKMNAATAAASTTTPRATPVERATPRCTRQPTIPRT